MRKIALLLCICLILSGCAMKKMITMKDAEDSIIKGKTTKQEILALFGKPEVKTKQGSSYTSAMQNMNIPMPAIATADEIWTYSRAKVDIGLFFNNVNATGLTIYFDKAGVVQDYVVSSSEQQYYSGP